jgi:hypothetical protein
MKNLAFFDNRRIYKKMFENLFVEVNAEFYSLEEWLIAFIIQLYVNLLQDAHYNILPQILWCSWNIRDFSPQANYTDRVTATCRRSYC